VSTFAYVSSKLGNVDPETRSIAKELYDKSKAAGHEIWFMWGMGAAGSEHGTGNALDLMVRNAAAGDWIRDYIWRNRERLRLIHVIWEQHITSTVVQPGVRRLMSDRGSVTQNHYDHVHVLFREGTYRAPASAPAPTPAPAPAPTPTGVRTLYYREGNVMTGTDVKRLQSGLKSKFPLYASNLVVDGKFGPATEKAVKEFQRRSNLTADGRVGPATRDKLDNYGIVLY
jgi:hypothetical protein